jgi:hypothetical protein
MLKTECCGNPSSIMHGLQPKCNEYEGTVRNGVECSKMGKQMFTMKSEEINHL